MESQTTITGVRGELAESHTTIAGLSEAQHADIEAGGSGAGIRVPFHGSGGRAG